MSNETAQQNDKVFKPPENMHFNIILTLASHFLKVNEQQQKKIYYKQLMVYYVNDHVCFFIHYIIRTAFWHKRGNEEVPIKI